MGKVRSIHAESILSSHISITNRPSEVNNEQGKGIDMNPILDIFQFLPYDWSPSFYSERLAEGFTRALCLGRGSSSISILHPPAQLIETGKVISNLNVTLYSDSESALRTAACIPIEVDI